jgi:preprotein translocase subunit YajC
MDTTGSAFTPLIFLFTFAILLYFMSIRPQQKRAKELQDMMNNLEKGD